MIFKRLMEFNKEEFKIKDRFNLYKKTIVYLNFDTMSFIEQSQIIKSCSMTAK